MSTAIIYHQVKPGTDCPDGIAAAWVAYRYLNRNYWDCPDITLLGCVYGEEPPNLHNFSEIYIVDFSFPRSTIESWQSTKDVYLFDHHKTALEMLGDVSSFELNRRIEIDLSECGATLTWRQFYKTEPPAFLQYVRDRDLWNFELPMSEEIHEAVSNLRYSIDRAAASVNLDPKPLLFALFDELAALDRDRLVEKLTPLGTKLLAPKRERILAAAQRFEMRKLPEPMPVTHDIPVVTCNLDGSEDRLISDICAKLYRDLVPDAPFVACISSDGKWSLRSNKHGSNYDVAEIAKHYNGGGHLNAAGFAPTTN